LSVYVDELFGRTRPRVRVLFGMLNPSNADAENPDPTLTRCMGFAQALGADTSAKGTAKIVGCYRYLLTRGDLSIVNLYAFRTPSPKEMWAAARKGVDIIGPENDRHILEAVGEADIVIAAWGADKHARARAAVVAAAIEKIKPLHCLRLTEKSGAPEHPLYLPGELVPIPYRSAA
jgi:hypothetical protein